MRYWKFTLLEGAFFFLNRAKSFSDTPTARAAKARYVRCSVMLSWQALEDAVKDVLKKCSTLPMLSKFSKRVELALTVLHHSSAFDLTSYRQNYKLRNDVVHVNAGSPDPTLNDAEAMFTYCKTLCGNLIPDGDKMEIKIEAL